MRKHLTIAILITCISLACKKEQSTSHIEKFRKEESSLESKQTESKLSLLSKSAKLIHEIKKKQNSITVFSKIESKEQLYVVEDKISNKSFLIESLVPIDFSKDLTNRKFISKLSFEDITGNKYVGKLSSKKKNSSLASRGTGDLGEFCIDWYWIIFNEKTGEIIAEVYVYTTCYDGSGGGGGSDGGANECSSSEEEAETILDGFRSEATNIVEEIGSGREVTDFKGIIRKPKTLQWMYTRIKNPAYGETEWSAYFAGIEFKNSQNDFWKWESFDFSSSGMSGGTIPPCLDVTGTLNAVSTTIDEDKKLARVSLHWSATLTYTCLTTTKVKAMSGPGTANFPAN